MPQVREGSTNISTSSTISVLIPVPGLGPLLKLVNMCMSILSIGDDLKPRWMLYLDYMKAAAGVPGRR